MIYLNAFKQLTDEAVDSLYGLVKDLINNNTTNILEVGTYAGQATVRLCAKQQERNLIRFSVISIDDNNDTFSPTAEESLRENHYRNYSIESGDIERRFEENVIKANIIYIDRLHDDIAKLMAFIQKSVIVPTKGNF